MSSAAAISYTVRPWIHPIRQNEKLRVYILYVSGHEQAIAGYFVDEAAVVKYMTRFHPDVPRAYAKEVRPGC